MVTRNSNGVRSERAVAAVVPRSADVRGGADGSGADLVINGQSMRVEWAVTGAVAAEALAPYLTSVTSAEVYVSADTVLGLEAAAGAAGLKSVEGGRLVLRPFPTRSTDRLATRVGGLRVAPWPRVYVDLGHGGVRGEDAAEHLKEVVCG